MLSKYVCKANCQCPSCSGENPISESIEAIQKSLAMRSDLELARRKDDGETILHRLRTAKRSPSGYLLS